MSEDSTRVATIAQPLMGDQCPVWHCGSNSPEIDNRGFHELHEGGLANTEGFRIVELRKGSITYRADVRGGKLYGLGRAGEIQLAAAQPWANLIGARLVIAHTSGSKYVVEIVAADTAVDYWAQLPGAGPQPKLESYILRWARTHDGVNPASRWKNVCSKASPALDVDALTMHGEHALLFEGDRIDAKGKTVSAIADDLWFNIGCAAHALSKLYLTGHTRAAGGDGFMTTTDHRQTMLKMLVADYCGDGIPFTVAGTPLSWHDANSWMTHAPALHSIEARWTPNGASCLEHPRIDVNSSPQSTLVAPGGAEPEIAASCVVRPPRCSELEPPNEDPDDLAGAYLVSANPPPVP